MPHNPVPCRDISDFRPCPDLGQNGLSVLNAGEWVPQNGHPTHRVTSRHNRVHSIAFVI